MGKPNIPSMVASSLMLRSSNKYAFNTTFVMVEVHGHHMLAAIEIFFGQCDNVVN